MGFALVQSAGASGSGAALTLAAVFGSTPTVGNMISVSLGAYLSGSNGPTLTVTVADSKGNTYTQDEHALLNNTGLTGAVSHQALDFWSFVPTTSGQVGSSFTITITCHGTTPSSFCNMCISEWSFTGGVPAVDGTGSANGSSSNVTNLPCGTPQVTGTDLVLAAASQLASATALVAAGGCTSLYANTYSAGVALGWITEYLLNTTTPNPAVPAATLAAGTSTGGFNAASITYKITPSAYTLTGPTTGLVSIASTNFTLTPSGTVGSDVVTPSDGGVGGSFTPSSLTFTSSAAPQTFVYTPTTVGPRVISLVSSSGFVITGNSPTYTVTVVATTYTFSGATATTLNQVSAPITLTPNGTVASDVVTPNDGGAGGTFTPTTHTWTSSAAGQTFTYTPATGFTGTVTMTFTDTASLTPSTYSFSVIKGVPYFFQVQGLPPGHASTATAAAYVTSGGTPTSASGCAFGTITEDSGTAGIYRGVVVYPTSLVPNGTLPYVQVTANSVTGADPSPSPTGAANIGANFAS